MRAGAPANALVTSPQSTVELNYLDPQNVTSPPIEAVSVTRELPSNLPASVVGGTGITAATATVTWAQIPDVTNKDVSPWAYNTTVPQPGTPALVAMDAGSGPQYVFTGLIEDSDGGTGQSVTSGLVDHLTAHFSRVVSISPKARWMYPPAESLEYRRVGLTYVYVVDAILRDCGYYLTPPWEYDTSVSMPMQGTVWAEYGIVQEATAAAGSSNSHASFFQADGRLYAGDFAVAVQPRAGGNHPVTDGVQISYDIAADSTGALDVRVYYGSNFVRLAVGAGGNAGAFWNGTSVATLNNVRGTRISLYMDGAETWQLRCSDGRSTSGTQTVSGSTVMSSVAVNAASAGRMCGLIVSHPGTVPARQHVSLSFTQTASVIPGTITHGPLEVSRAVTSEKALDVLLEIARATCSAMWLDEDGHFQWRGPGILDDQSPVTTVQARTSLLSLDWRVSLDHVRHQVIVSWDAAAISRSRWAKITLYDGRSESLVVGDTIEEFIEVPADEDWLGVKLPALYAGQATGGDERMNRGLDSWVGGSAVNDTGNPVGVWFSPSFGSASITSVGDNKYLYRMEVSTMQPASEEFVTRMVPGGGGLWPKNDGMNLPILRGYAKATYAQQSTTNELQYNGPTDSPVLEHDGGKWLSAYLSDTPYDAGDRPGRLANWIAQQTRVPAVEVTGLEIMPDPRLQLGDVINVTDPDNLGVTLRVLITGITLSQSGPGMSMTLAARVIAASPTAITWAQFEDAWAGANYAALEAAWDGQTYADLEANPLEESP